MKSLLLSICILMGAKAFAIRESGGRMGSSAVYLDFRSYGTGIDSQTKTYVLGLIGEAGMKGQVVNQTSSIYGKEGESIECVQLNDATTRYYFVKAVAPYILNDTQIYGHQRTAVFVGADCSDIESATEQDLGSYIEE